jgi:NAD+ synthase (glutamine-hydrolysing)
VLLPELAITGYPPEDLLLKPHFLQDARVALERLAARCTETTCIVGLPLAEDAVYNAAAVLSGGAVHAIYRKNLLPNYGVFDEQRYFTAGPRGTVLDGPWGRIGLTVCEDIWVPGAPSESEAHAGAWLITNISASPYHAGKGAEREAMLAARAIETGAYIAFCALVGGQDELVFDGHSCVIDPAGTVVARAAQFEPELLLCEITESADKPVRADADVEIAPPLGATPVARGASQARRIAPLLEPPAAEVYGALRLGLHDYVEKNGFQATVLGLSGGIDSALVATLAVDALGPERVNVAVMPSPFSSSATQDDARALAAALGAGLHELHIEPVMGAYTATLADEFVGRDADITEENLQARIRGNLLMALSNKFGWLVLTTGNKSEMSVGYSTLYGDLAGGFAVIKDVPKMLVFQLSEWRNTRQAADVVGGVPAPIPPSIIERPPSAELRPDQRDEDSLPPYELLDRILEGYVEQNLSAEQLIAAGLDADAVRRTVRLVDLAEYKRRQAPPGVKITPRAFGRDRRMPITNGYRG